MINFPRLALLFVAAAWFSLVQQAGAQTPPAMCKPNVGGTRDCTVMLQSPYSFLPATCASSTQSESSDAANSIWEAATLPGIQQCPNSKYEETGWVPRSSPMCSGGPCGGGYPQFNVSCGGAPSAYPSVWPSSGIEVSNWLIKSVEYDSPAPSCSVHHSQYFWGAVRRSRQLYCPRGYVSHAGYCYAHSGRLDPAKNLGGQCPTCGNPISLNRAAFTVDSPV